MQVGVSPKQSGQVPDPPQLSVEQFKKHPGVAVAVATTVEGGLET